MKIEVIEEHNEIVDLIKEASKKSKNDFIFVNVDSHSDLGVYELGKEPTIGSFITYLVYGGFLKKYLWIKNNKNLNEFEDGFYKSSLWLDKNNTLVFDLNHKLCYLNGVYGKNAPINSKKFSFQVVSEEKLNKFKINDEKWFLSIDCDYFSCSNPFKNELDQLKKNFPSNDFEKMLIDFSKIKDEKDFLSFMCHLNRLEKIDFFNEAFDINFDELVFSKNEILKKINLVLTFLKQNFDIKKCLGIVLCKSESSGYTKKENVQFILDNLKKSLNEYLK